MCSFTTLDDAERTHDKWGGGGDTIDSSRTIPVLEKESKADTIY